MVKGYLGIDVGSISTKGVVIDKDCKVLASSYLRTQGTPINSIKKLLRELVGQLDSEVRIVGAGTTGSARRLAGVVIQADIVKNEIIAHAVAVGQFYPEARTVFEIGGQDSKIIILRDGIPIDFAMNNVCAAGTGSFLDHQAARLDIPIEEFGDLALRAKNHVNIAGRCTVFAESDMIHKAQLGIATEDIVAGLCDAIVRNYMNAVARGKDLQPLFLFQGGVAANIGVRRAFERTIEQKVVVPKYFLVMGAIGAAILASEEVQGNGTRFAGFETADVEFETRAFECNGCPNRCEVIEILREGKVIDRYGDRCGKWSENLEKPSPGG
ncbi:2-hydroxyglutaryl-CoA dehydratase [candidate division WOR-3 bacterium JGI_Cruoil_03_51_56]|uniref:2-hydroxyglutaryl-CoA dehydratase n=1 Tax=candidate division WOR-3 bacterium JGI_Cruoil_03_51_56 TaxID=1973747 RepID=A0A235BR95_UNCW3|nr:MAG: 2-hydroxyglutaryl-CoA dehydratase [candidate division WOR-3 bacterium JGI_Cruoil_03_51_56]